MPGVGVENAYGAERRALGLMAALSTGSERREHEQPTRAPSPSVHIRDDEIAFLLDGHVKVSAVGAPPPTALRTIAQREMT